MADSDKVIALKIEVQSVQAYANIKKLEKSLEGLDRRRRESKEIIKQISEEQAKLNSLRSLSINANTKAEKSIDRLNKAHKQGKSAVGASTSATLELGRVLSDMPYGIRGVANNLQQLASNLFFMSKATNAATGKTLGFGGAIGGLLKGLAGPAGILIAFQGVIALFDYFSTHTSDAEKATNKLAEAIGGTAGAVAKLDALKEVVDDSNSSIQSQENALSELKKKGYDPLTDSLDDFINKQKELLVLEATSSIFKQEVEEIATQIAEVNILKNTLTEDFTENIKNLSKDPETFADYFKKMFSNIFPVEEIEAFANAIQLESVPEAIDKMNIKLDEKVSEYKANYKRILDLIRSNVNGKKVPFLKEPKEFAKEAEDYIKAIRGTYKKIALLDLKEKDSKIIVERMFHLDELNRQNSQDKLKYEQQASAYKKTLILYLDQQVALNKLSKSDRNKAISDFDSKTKEELSIMDTNFKLLLKKWKEYYALRIKSEEEFELASSKIVLKSPVTGGADKYTIAATKLEKFAQNYKKVQDSLTSFMNGEYDRQSTIEQNKTNALNNELNERLLNENLSKDERERIQLQIGANDDKLRKKQEAIEKKKFKMNKAANIANALINTAVAASGVMKDAKGGFFARLAQAIPTIAFGLAQVATIARTKFQSSAGSGGSIGAAAGSNGGEGESREFNFNLAGSTQSNQLTQSIAGQLSQPIQTYVVSSEITSQQQLDLSISNTASLG